MNVDLENVQSLLFQTYPCKVSLTLFFTLKDQVSGQRFLRGLEKYISYGVKPIGPPFVNVGLTATGIRLLRPEWPLEAFDPIFVEGPDPIRLGDAYGSESQVNNWWEKQFVGSAVHCLVNVYAETANRLEAFSQYIFSLADETETRPLSPRANKVPLYGEALGGNRVHFGYVDGLSTLPIRWTDNTSEAGELDFRHFVLGYSTSEIESSPSPRDEPMATEVRDSSYLIFRWVYQDVAKFNQFIRLAARTLFPGLDLMYAQELVAAKLMGRWRDGTPLVLSPIHPDPSLARVEFDYTSDDLGHKCPFSAHIRVTNPRNQPLDPASSLQGVPRLIRRGMPYGPELTSEQDDSVDRGVLGMFLCSNINRQFYTLMKWMTKNNFSPVYEGNWKAQDGITANRRIFDQDGTFRIPRAEGDLYLTKLPDFLRTKGTLFCLLPSRSAIHHLYL